MNLFELCAKLTLSTDEYEKKVEGAKQTLSKVGDVVGAVAKAGAVAIGAGATAVSALTKRAVDSYADFEQLVGGVETLFKDNAQKVKEYAAVAYQTAGLSANEYMETVTSFSASLLQSLGGDTAKASEKANQAIIDMSDNANKMGSTMESIQNAYNGFSKQNYTMLDNLKLGYGGTKEEMQRLLDDAGKLANTKFNIESYADVVDAIHVIQESMDIAGTTAKEASTTISGSISSMKASWENMLTALATGDTATIQAQMNNLVASVKTVGENLKPVIIQTLQGIGELIKGLAPVIAEVLPTVVNDVLPAILESAVELVKALASALIDNLDTIMDTGLELLMGLLEGIADNLPKIMDTALKVILKLVDSLTSSGNLAKIIQASTKIIIELGVGLIKAIPQLIKRIPEIYSAITEGFIAGVKDMWPVGGQIIEGLWKGIKERWTRLTTDVKTLASGLVSTVKSMFGIHSPSKVFANIGEMCVAGLEEGSEGLFSTDGLTAKVSADVSSTSAINGNNDVLTLLQQYLPTIASGNQIVLDTGALVGSTAKLYNAELGRLALRGSY